MPRRPRGRVRGACRPARATRETWWPPHPAWAGLCLSVLLGGSPGSGAIQGTAAGWWRVAEGVEASSLKPCRAPHRNPRPCPKPPCTGPLRLVGDSTSTAAEVAQSVYPALRGVHVVGTALLRIRRDAALIRCAPPSESGRPTARWVDGAGSQGVRRPRQPSCIFKSPDGDSEF